MVHSALLLAVLAAVPANYLVFEIDRHDAITLVSADAVTVVAGEVEGSPTTSPDAVDVELRDANGIAIWQTSVPVDRYIRAEFPNADGTIDGQRIERERVPFVVRVPDGGETIELTSTRSRSISQFAVRALPLASHAAETPRIRGDAGNPANRLDILIMGDGYTSAETAKFDEDVQRITSQFFDIQPYKSYRSFVNVTTRFVASPQSGADHPLCADGGFDPKAGTSVNTAFDATYCSSGLQRLLTVNYAKVYAAAAAVPNWDVVMVVVNDSLYGGAGGSVCVVSTHAQAVGVAQHEFGHTFTGLADEYSTPYPSYPPCTDLSGAGTCEPNVTNQAARASIKWSPWINTSTTIPTLPPFSGVGLFEGARYQSTGFFRPKNECLMGILGRPFCEVCAQAFVLRLYNGWKTGARVDLIENVTPSDANLSVSAGQAVPFSAEILNPDGGAARVRWLVDGAEASSSASFTLSPAIGTHTVELRVTDPATFVNPQMAGGALTKTRTWAVVATAPSAAKKRRAIH